VTRRLEAENVALRRQLIILRRKVRGRVHLSNGDRFFFVQLYRWFSSQSAPDPPDQRHVQTRCPAEFPGTFCIFDAQPAKPPYASVVTTTESEVTEITETQILAVSMENEDTNFFYFVALVTARTSPTSGT
jgi:hypothetical protein